MAHMNRPAMVSGTSTIGAASASARSRHVGSSASDSNGVITAPSITTDTATSMTLRSARRTGPGGAAGVCATGSGGRGGSGTSACCIGRSHATQRGCASTC